MRQTKEKQERRTKTKAAEETHEETHSHYLNTTESEYMQSVFVKIFNYLRHVLQRPAASSYVAQYYMLRQIGNINSAACHTEAYPLQFYYAYAISCHLMTNAEYIICAFSVSLLFWIVLPDSCNISL